MRILVCGAGVLGCNLANNLYRAKKDVTLLARGRWGESLSRDGLHIKKMFRLREMISHIPVIDRLAPDDRYDVIFVVMRYTQLDSFMDDLGANVTENVVLVGNNIYPARYEAMLPGKNVLFAFTMAAGHREPGRVAAIDLKKITIGTLRPGPSREGEVRRLFERTGYRVVYEPNMEDYLLSHAAFVIPVGFACYYTDGDLRKLKGNTAYLNQVVDGVIEGYRAIERAGHHIRPASDEAYETAGFRRFCLGFFRLMCATKLGKICASDHAMNAIDEMSALNRDMKAFMTDAGAEFDTWRALERGAGKYMEL